MKTNDQVVFIVVDDAPGRASVAALAESIGIRPDSYCSAEAFLSAYDEAQDGCLVANIRLPGMSGLELLEALSSQPLRPPALMLTEIADVPTAVRAMALGAITVFQKPYRDKDLGEAIQQALVIGSHRRQDAAHAREWQARLAQLTSEEAQVLDFIFAGRTNKWIARTLGVGLRTVEARRHSIMAKFAVHSVAELVRVVCETRALARDTLPLRCDQPPQSAASNGSDMRIDSIPLHQAILRLQNAARTVEATLRARTHD